MNKLIIKQCHVCTHVIETEREPEKCPQCNKSYLPLNYFHKIHSHEKNIVDLFCEAHELDEDTIIHGLYVLW